MFQGTNQGIQDPFGLTDNDPMYDFSWVHISYIEGNNPKICSLSSQRGDILETWGPNNNDQAIVKGDFIHNIEIKRSDIVKVFGISNI